MRTREALDTAERTAQHAPSPELPRSVPSMTMRVQPVTVESTYGSPRHRIIGALYMNTRPGLAAPRMYRRFTWNHALPAHTRSGTHASARFIAHEQAQ
jgi:hypothetical protein